MCACVHVRVLIITEGKRRSSDVTHDILVIFLSIFTHIIAAVYLSIFTCIIIGIGIVFGITEKMCDECEKHKRGWLT